MWLYYDIYLKNEWKVRFFKIMKIKNIEIKRTLKYILKKYDNIVLKKTYNIRNCIIIKHTIRLLDKILVVDKQ